MKHFFATLLTIAALSPAAMAIEIPTTTPVKVNFDEWDATSFENSFSVVNANNDSQKFVFGSKYSGNQEKTKFVNFVSIKWFDSGSHNDWVISKTPVTLTAGETYDITCTVSTKQAAAMYNETFEFKAGTSSEHTAMTLPVIAPTEFSTNGVQYGPDVEKNGIKVFSGTLTPTATGSYYFGLHLTTNNTDCLYMGYHGFTVTKRGGEEPGDPSGIEDIYADDNQPVEIYDLNGRRVNDAAVPGIYIVRRADGTTHKLIIR